MAGTQAQRPTISQHEGTSATRLRTNRTNAQHSQTTVITTTQSGPNSQSHQYANTIGCSSSSGNGTSTIAISTITTAPNPSRQLLESSQLLQEPQHVEIVLNDDNDDAEQIAAERDAAEHTTKRVRHRRHKRPFYRRVFNYIRTAWTGVNFSSSNDSELEELETTPRYRPDSLSALSRSTRFSEAEIKRIYRGFKAECPTGVVKEDTFKIIYSQFFPQGANTGLYAHYVFNTLDSDHSGIVSFEEFVQNLSTLLRGTMEEKLRWAFQLYDINGDGFITREEMTDIAIAIYELMGRNPESIHTTPDPDQIKDKVEKIFTKMDLNRDGVVTLDEFLECCRNDEMISRSLHVFDSGF
ncbi:Kv channel-interacting protein 4 isoform X2 [Sitodiplosis mosellana]|uniref:Kv channel-interacting protein 4 isoform X2 n=1 Tax=Sitodiplosis mosellana TaxID=263140 RepID=UPI00244507DD|nr:Kv channel-interacting protein 4 isoform X2 [Sitodiplosis mosellana]